MRTKRTTLSLILLVVVFAAVYLTMSFAIPGFRIKLEAEPAVVFVETLKILWPFKAAVSLIVAVLEKRGSLKVSQCDAYMNIIGGLTLDEPAADLAAVVAIASSYLDKPVPGTMAAVGEVGLSGEIRSITHMEQRLSEVRRLGFTQCMVPAHKVKDLKAPAGLELLPVENISRALRLLAQGK